MPEPGGLPGISERGLPVPKGIANQKRDQRIEALHKMTGQDYAMSVATDFICLKPDERKKAVRVLSALDTTIEKEMAAA